MKTLAVQIKLEDKFTKTVEKVIPAGIYIKNEGDFSGVQIVTEKGKGIQSQPENRN